MIPRIEGIYSSWKLSRYFKKLKIDLIHSFHYGDDYSEAFSARFAGIPWVFTKKNMSWGNKSKNSWKIRSLLASKIIVQNNEMISSFYPKSNKISYIPRGVNIKDFPYEKKNYNLDKYNLPKNKKIITSVANLVPVKGIHILIEAFELLCREDNSFFLLIVGNKETVYGKMMQEKSKSSHYKKNICFVGEVLDVKPFLSISSLFVLPTLNEGRKEGCPVSLLEAMAMGINVLASKIAGVEDILSNFPNNMFVPGDKRLLYEAILKQFKNSNRNRNKNFRKFISEYYSLSKEVESHEMVYKSCLKL